MQYVIMANGASSRWKNYLGIPKHLAKVGDETLIGRTVRMLHELDPEARVVITAHDTRYQVEGARLYRPIHGELEIDRFPPELLDQPTVFLYGDTFYTEAALRTICAVPDGTDPGEEAPPPTHAPGAMRFYGSRERIFAVRATDFNLMRALLDELRARVIHGDIPDCKGWQLYHRYLNMPLEGKEVAGAYEIIDDQTTDFNTPDEYRAFLHMQ